MFLLKLLLASAILFGFGFALAAEHEGGPEAKKEGAKEETAATTGPVKADEWLELSGRVQALKAKIKLRQDNLKKFIEEKQVEKSPQKVAEIIKQMVEEHKGLEKDAAEYNQQSSVLRYRFPEKSLAGEKRKYERVEVGTLEQLENQMTLDVKIKKTVSKAQRQFPNRPQYTEPSLPPEMQFKKGRRQRLPHRCPLFSRRIQGVRGREN